MTAAHWSDPKWRYRTARQTSRPGYLAARFRQIRAEQAQAEAQKVVPIKKSKP